MQFEVELIRPARGGIKGLRLNSLLLLPVTLYGNGFTVNGQGFRCQQWEGEKNKDRRSDCPTKYVNPYYGLVVDTTIPFPAALG